MPHFKMLPKLCPRPRLFSARLGEPPPQSHDSFVHIILEFHGAVKGDPRRQRAFRFRRDLRGFHEPLERSPRLVVDLDLPRANPDLPFQPPGGDEKIEQRGQMSVDLGQEGQFLGPLQAVVADVLADHSTVLLLDEAVVVLVSAAVPRKGDALPCAPRLGRAVHEFRAVVAVELGNGERDGGPDAGKLLENPPVGVVQRRVGLNPAREHVGGGPGIGRWWPARSGGRCRFARNRASCAPPTCRTCVSGCGF